MSCYRIQTHWTSYWYPKTMKIMLHQTMGGKILLNTCWKLGQWCKSESSFAAQALYTANLRGTVVWHLCVRFWIKWSDLQNLKLWQALLCRASHHPEVYMGTGKLSGQPNTMLGWPCNGLAMIPSRGSGNYCFMLQLHSWTPAALYHLPHLIFMIGMEFTSCYLQGIYFLWRMLMSVLSK